MARPIQVNVPRYLIDLNDESHWLYTASPPITRVNGKAEDSDVMDQLKRLNGCSIKSFGLK